MEKGEFLERQEGREEQCGPERQRRDFRLVEKGEALSPAKHRNQPRPETSISTHLRGPNASMAFGPPRSSCREPRFFWPQREATGLLGRDRTVQRATANEGGSGCISKDL